MNAAKQKDSVNRLIDDEMLWSAIYANKMRSKLNEFRYQIYSKKLIKQNYSISLLT